MRRSTTLRSPYRPAGGRHSSYLNRKYDRRLRSGRRTALRASFPALRAGASLILFRLPALRVHLGCPENALTANTLVRPPLRYGRRWTALRASFPTLRAGVTHLISIASATVDCVAISPEGMRFAIAGRLPYGRPYPLSGRELLVLFKSWMRPSLRYGHRRTAQQGRPYPPAWAGVTHLI